MSPERAWKWSSQSDKEMLFFCTVPGNRKSPRKKLQGNIFSPTQAGNVLPATECVRQSPVYYLAQIGGTECKLCLGSWFRHLFKPKYSLCGRKGMGFGARTKWWRRVELSPSLPLPFLDLVVFRTVIWWRNTLLLFKLLYIWGVICYTFSITLTQKLVPWSGTHATVIKIEPMALA